jgi:hypothetical protein
MPNYDYWLFDSRKLVRMHFDDADVLLSGEIVEEPAEIVQHNYWRDVAWLPRQLKPLSMPGFVSRRGSSCSRCATTSTKQ